MNDTPSSESLRRAAAVLATIGSHQESAGQGAPYLETANWLESIATDQDVDALVRANRAKTNARSNPEGRAEAARQDAERPGEFDRVLREMGEQARARDTLSAKLDQKPRARVKRQKRK